MLRLLRCSHRDPVNHMSCCSFSPKRSVSNAGHICESNIRRRKTCVTIVAALIFGLPLVVRAANVFPLAAEACDGTCIPGSFVFVLLFAFDIILVFCG